MFEVGQKMIRQANINVITRDDFAEAAQMAVRCSQIIDLAEAGNLEAALKMKMKCDCDPLQGEVKPSPGNVGNSGFGNPAVKKSESSMIQKPKLEVSKIAAMPERKEEKIVERRNKISPALKQTLTPPAVPGPFVIKSPSAPLLNQDSKKSVDVKKDDKKAATTFINPPTSSSVPSPLKPVKKSPFDPKQPTADKKTSSTVPSPSKDDKSPQDSKKESDKKDPFSNGDTVIV